MEQVGALYNKLGNFLKAVVANGAPQDPAANQ